MTSGQSRFTRRVMLRMLAMGAASVASTSLLAACAPNTPAPNKPAETKPAAPSDSQSAASASANVPGAASAPTSAPAAAAPTPAQKAAAAVKPGGALVIGQDVAPINLDPQKTGSFPSVEAFEHIYEGLTAFDEKLNVVPALAESWETPDPTTYVFHLRRGVKWHNGRTFVSSDVKYWYDRIMDPKTASGDRVTFSVIKQVDLLDDYTVKMTLSKPYASLLPYMASIRGATMPNRETAEQHGDLTSHAIGTGPFKLAEYVPNSYTKYVKNPDYWKPGVPSFDELTLTVMPEEDQRVAALRSGQIHLTTLGPIGAQRLANERSVSVLRSTKAQLWMMEINSQRKPFDDVRVRKALSMAIDRQAMIDKVVQGEGQLSGPTPTGHGDWAIPPEKLPYRQDIEGAKRLLAEAGLPDGVKATIKTSAAYVEMVGSSIEMKNQVKAAGIDLNIEQLEWGQLVAAGDNGAAADKISEFELLTARFIFFPDPDFFIGSFTPERNRIIRGKNEAVKDARITELLEMGQGTTDHAERKKIYDEAMMRQLQDVIPALWLFNGSQIDGISNRLTNFTPSFMGLRYLIKNASFSA